MCQLNRDERVMATLGGVISDEQTRIRLGRWIHHWDEYGFGIWTFRDPSTKIFVGRAGLHKTVIEGVVETELLYAVRAEFWRLGYATEMSESILRLAAREMSQVDLACFTMMTNVASRRTMEKLGFRYERDIVRANLPHVLCRLPRSELIRAYG